MALKRSGYGGTTSPSQFTIPKDAVTTAVFAGAERDDDDDDDGLAWGEVISYEPSPDLGDVPVAVPIPSAPPAEAAPSAPRAAEVAPAAYAS